MLARWNAAETYNEVEKLKQVLRWDKKELGLFIRAHSAYTEQISLCKRNMSKTLFVDEMSGEPHKILQKF